MKLKLLHGYQFYHSSEELIATDKALFFIRKMLITFLFLDENRCWGFSLEVPHRGASNEYHNICFRREIRKICGYPLFSVAMEDANHVKTDIIMSHIKQKSDFKCAKCADTDHPVHAQSIIQGSVV